MGSPVSASPSVAGDGRFQPLAAASAEPAQTVLLRDGRVLAFCSYGDLDGRPMIYFHGGGSSRLEPAYADRYAARNRIRLIAIDRPGYGRSTPRQDYRFETVASDVLELADTLRLDRFAVAGMSAGAGFALHLARLAATRVSAVALINPSPDTRHPLWKRSPLIARLAIAASSIPWLLNRATRSLLQDPEKAAKSMVSRTGWSQESVEQFAAMTREGLRQSGGIAMLTMEARMLLHTSWRLDWSAIRCPVLAICGIDDQARGFYQLLAQQHPQLTTMDVPGPHMPIVAAQAWDRIGALLSSHP